MTGWRIMQSHQWGQHIPTPFTWIHADGLTGVEGHSHFELMAAPLQTLPMMTRNAAVGRVVLADKTYVFNSLRNFWDSNTQQSGDKFTFELQGPQGKCRGQ